MLTLDLSKQAFSFLEQVPVKQGRQIAEKLLALCNDPSAIPSEALKGYAPLRRAKAGEFRIVFVVEGDFLRVRVIAKRNDDEVYKMLKRGAGS
jgi:mRNA interferase RelE/StbE